MKKSLQTGFIISMIFLSANVFGQTNGLQLSQDRNVKKTAKTYFDLMVNMQSTNLHYGGSNSTLSGYKRPVKGIQAGASFQAGITPVFSLVSELYFMKKGGELKTGNSLYAKRSTLRLNTLELPVLARFHAGKLYMNAGPSIAYSLSGNKKIDDSSAKLSFGKSVGSFKRLDAGIQIGGGLELPLKQKRIAVDLRYNYGLTNISYGNEMYNRSFMVSVHFSKLWKTNPFEKVKNSTN
jgi:hypothetical protein